MKRCSKPSIITEMHFITIIPRWSVVKNPSAKQETRVQSLGWEDSLEKERATHSSILFTIFLIFIYFLSEGYLLYRFCSLSNLNMNQSYYILHIILAWRIPWPKEPGRLQSMGSQRVGHDWIDLARRAFLLYLFGSPFVPLIQKNWQKQSQYCKVSIYQFKIKLKKKETSSQTSVRRFSRGAEEAWT